MAEGSQREGSKRRDAFIPMREKAAALLVGGNLDIERSVATQMIGLHWVVGWTDVRRF